MKPQMRLEPGEYIMVGLPNFFLPSDSPLLQTLSGQAYDGLTAVFMNATEERPYSNILLLPRNPVLPGQTISLVIPESAGVRLPLYGNTRNNPKLVLGTNAASGKVWEQPIEVSVAVGSFGASTTVHVKGTDVYVSFTPSMRLAPGDSITIGMPYFTTASPNANNTNVGGTSGAIFNSTASVQRAEDGSSITVIAKVASGMTSAPFDVVSMILHGLQIDAGQMLADRERHLTISSDASDGRVLVTVIEKVCKVSPGFSRCCSKVQCLF